MDGSPFNNRVSRNAREKRLDSTVRGFTLLEPLLAAALLALMTLGILTAIAYGEDSEIVVHNRTQALFLAQEGLEATRSIRDGDFTLVAGSYGIASSSGMWSFVPGSDDIGAFARTIAIVDIDANLKQVTSSVSWDAGQRSVILETHLGRWR